MTVVSLDLDLIVNIIRLRDSGPYSFHCHARTPFRMDDAPITKLFQSWKETSKALSIIGKGCQETSFQGETQLIGAATDTAHSI